LTELPTLHVT